MKETDTITIRQMFDAFHSVFHNAGDEYFGGERNDTVWHFRELLEAVGVPYEEADRLTYEMLGPDSKDESAVIQGLGPVAVGFDRDGRFVYSGPCGEAYVLMDGKYHQVGFIQSGSPSHGAVIRLMQTPRAQPASPAPDAPADGRDDAADYRSDHPPDHQTRKP